MFEHILVPLDGSPLAECALPHCLAIALAFDSRITLINIVERNWRGAGPAPRRSAGVAHPQDRGRGLFERHCQAAARRRRDRTQHYSRRFRRRTGNRIRARREGRSDLSQQPRAKWIERLEYQQCGAEDHLARLRAAVDRGGAYQHPPGDLTGVHYRRLASAARRLVARRMRLAPRRRTGRVS